MPNFNVKPCINTKDLIFQVDSSKLPFPLLFKEVFLSYLCLFCLVIVLFVSRLINYLRFLFCLESWLFLSDIFYKLLDVLKFCYNLNLNSRQNQRLRLPYNMTGTRRKQPYINNKTIK